ncbi:unnamed protein product [Pseudo-nitzschia multistriata]|uniref:Uncharacterized protein n=1 Tax=Pseudo-nitzschia multistriata TaxID=183589 RepID=A0A448Z5Z1_9STRA|nr:unnamed protein product [Pseudo-nitzschia multistriata]
MNAKSTTMGGKKSSSKSSTKPSSRIEVDLEDKSSRVRRKSRVGDEKSNRSSTSKSTRSTASRSATSAKTSSKASSTTTFHIEVDFDEGPSRARRKSRIEDEQSNRRPARESTILNTRTKENNKTESRLTDDEISIRSKTKKSDDETSIISNRKKSKKKKKSKIIDEYDDDDSVLTIQSSRSIASKSRKKSSKKKKKGTLSEGENPSCASREGHSLQADLRRINALEEENAVLLDETVALRRQLRQVEQFSKQSSLGQKSIESSNVEVNDLKMELEEYEYAVIEKDELIQKLTEAVDAQVDKVEYLEAKLVRAEEEFCTMEDELADMEELVHELNDSPRKYKNHTEEYNSSRRRKELEKREITIEEKEKNLEEKEAKLLEKEKILEKMHQSFSSDIEINDDEDEDEDNTRGKQELLNELNKTKKTIQIIEAENNELWEENEILRESNSKLKEKKDTAEEDDSIEQKTSIEVKELTAKLLEMKAENNNLRKETESLQKNNVKMKEKEDVAIQQNASREKALAKVEEIKAKMLVIRLENDDLYKENDLLRRNNSERKGKENATVQQDDSGEQELKNEVEELKAKILEIRLEKDGILKEYESLRQRNEQGALKEREMANKVEELKSNILEVQAEKDDVWKENESLRQQNITAEKKAFKEQEMQNEINKLKAKVIETEAINNNLRKDNESLLEFNAEIKEKEKMAQQDALRTKEMSNEIEELKAKIIEVESSKIDLLKKNESLCQRESEMKEEKKAIEIQRNKELRIIRDSIDKQMADMDLEKEILRKELNEMKQRKNADNEALRQDIEELRKQKNHLEAISNHSKRLETIRSMDSVQIFEDTDSAKSFEDDCQLELEIEIAELREKIVQQEGHFKKQKQEIEAILKANKDLKEDVRERERELDELENQLNTSKESSMKKMEQKDETIAFMQNEIMNITQENQQLANRLRELNLDQTERELVGNTVENEAEKKNAETGNDHLRQLEEKNRRLEDELKQTRYNNSLRQKEKQSIILELQDELRDAKWELGARDKGADYITLLKERREGKKLLVEARNELMRSREKVTELNLAIDEAISHKKDLEKEVESLNLTMDSSAHRSSLKRQIKSLKQHNAALERRLEIQTRESQENVQEKEAKVRILQFELDKVRSLGPKATKGVFSDFLFATSTKSAVDETSTQSENNTYKSNKEFDEINFEYQFKNEISSPCTNSENEDCEGTTTDTVWNLFSRSSRRESLQENEQKEYDGSNPSIMDSAVPTGDVTDIVDTFLRESPPIAHNSLGDNDAEKEADAVDIAKTKVHGDELVITGGAANVNIKNESDKDNKLTP